MRTIMFCFGGRRENLELQLPFIHRILDEHPEVEYHLWDLAVRPSDSEYIQSLPTRDRLAVIDAFAGDHHPWAHFNDVYRHYTHPEYSDAQFVKVDDDVVFIQTNLFGDFLSAIEPDDILSAQVINNGACTPTFPQLWKEWQTWREPLLDVHQSAEYAELSHQFFFDNWRSLVGQEMNDLPTTDWLSINFIGYTYATGKAFAEKLGTPSPKYIAGRKFFTPRSKLGDEGMANTMGRRILTGFVACHLTFGPQTRRIRNARWAELRQRYAEIGRRYLEN